MLTEGYFDESGDFEAAPNIFCLAGYYIESGAAKVMDEKWDEVLRTHNIPYFHMVDCAHGSEPFAKMEKAERSEIARKMIELIKGHTMDGFAVVTRKDLFEISEQHPDPYTSSVNMCVRALQAWIEGHRIGGDIAYFFESGHKNKGRAYRGVAETLAKSGHSLTFAAKDRVRLLQAADILAWQVTKYVKDAISKKRPPRKDFLGLMEHRHTIWLADTRDNQGIFLIEDWPESRRPKSQAALLTEKDRSNWIISENGNIQPVLIVDKASSWFEGPQNLACVTVDAIGGRQITLGFDNIRINELIGTLFNATNMFAGVGQILLLNGTDFSFDVRGDDVFLRVHTPDRIILAVKFTGQAASSMKEKFKL